MRTGDWLDSLARRIGTAIGTEGAGRYLALAFAWLLLWRLSALMQTAPHASIWFPPAGVSFAALLIMGWRAIPVLMGCAMVVTFWVDRMYQSHAPLHELLMTGVLFGVAHCVSYGVAAALLRRLVERSGAHSIPVIAIVFLVSACLAALCAALAGVQALEAAGLLDASATPGLWLPWWIGDMAGALVLTPLCVGVLSRRFPRIETWLGGLDFRHQGSGHGYWTKLAVSISLLSLLMLLAAHFRHSEIAFAVFFLIIPQMWIVYTENPLRSALSLALFSTALAVWVAVFGLIEQALVYQFAICVIAASTCFGLAVPVLIARNLQLSELAYSDGLTKTVSKGYFFEHAEHKLADARRHTLPVSLIVLDLDHFKQFNDAFGHAIGDQALVRLAVAVRMQLRQSDLFGRFGGDEFMILLPGLDLDAAMECAERMRQLLLRTEVTGTNKFLSASFGVVRIADDESVMQAFRRADHELLQAKRGGRNSVGSGRGELKLG